MHLLLLLASLSCVAITIGVDELYHLDEESDRVVAASIDGSLDDGFWRRY